MFEEIMYVKKYVNVMVTGRREAVTRMTSELCFSQLVLLQGHLIDESNVNDELFHKVQKTS